MLPPAAETRRSLPLINGVQRSPPAGGRRDLLLVRSCKSCAQEEVFPVFGNSENSVLRGERESFSPKLSAEFTATRLVRTTTSLNGFKRGRVPSGRPVLMAASCLVPASPTRDTHAKLNVLLPASKYEVRKIRRRENRLFSEDRLVRAQAVQVSSKQEPGSEVVVLVGPELTALNGK